MGKFPEFFIRVRRDPNDDIDHKRKICPTIQFLDMISQNLNLSLFATSEEPGRAEFNVTTPTYATGAYSVSAVR